MNEGPEDDHKKKAEYHADEAKRLSIEMSPVQDSNMDPHENLIAPHGLGVLEILIGLTDFELASGQVRNVTPDEHDLGNGYEGLLGDLEKTHADIIIGDAILFQYKRPGENYFNQMFVYKYVNSEQEGQHAVKEFEQMVADEKKRRLSSSSEDK